MIDKIFWLGHASIKISGSKTIYFDPWEIDKNTSADIIIVSHSHYDHFSPPDIEKLTKPETRIFLPYDCRGRLTSGNATYVKPGETHTVDNVTLKFYSAYNPAKAFHPKANNWVGAVVEMDGSSCYFAGDTEFINEMEVVKADIAIVPVCGTYTMDPKQAADCVNMIKPKWAIPVHWGKTVGSKKDAEEFAKLANCEVKILQAL